MVSPVLIKRTRPALSIVKLQTAFDMLPPEYQYRLVHKDGSIVAATVAWLDTPADGIIQNGQVWQFADDGKHAKPLNETERVRFWPDSAIPILLFGHLSTGFTDFLREIRKGTCSYVRG